MALDILNDDAKRKVKETIASGEQVLSEIETLKEDMREYVKNLAEELNIKPAIINKAIRIAYKQRSEDAIGAARDEMSDVETLLHAAGKLDE